MFSCIYLGITKHFLFIGVYMEFTLPTKILKAAANLAMAKLDGSSIAAATKVQLILEPKRVTCVYTNGYILFVAHHKLHLDGASATKTVTIPASILKASLTKDTNTLITITATTIGINSISIPIDTSSYPDYSVVVPEDTGEAPIATVAEHSPVAQLAIYKAVALVLDQPIHSIRILSTRTNSIVGHVMPRSKPAQFNTECYGVLAPLVPHAAQFIRPVGAK